MTEPLASWMEESPVRQRLLAALAKPLPEDHDMSDSIDHFNPWHDVIQGISGSYSSISNEFMVELLEAVRDRKHMELIEKHGVGGDLGLFILAGQDLVEYGGSPYGCWPAPEVADLWQPLIDKWKTFNTIVWRVEYERISVPTPPNRFSRNKP